MICLGSRCGAQDDLSLDAPHAPECVAKMLLRCARAPCVCVFVGGEQCACVSCLSGRDCLSSCNVVSVPARDSAVHSSVLEEAFFAGPFPAVRAPPSPHALCRPCAFTRVTSKLCMCACILC